MSLFIEISLVLLIAFIFSFIMRLLKQPLIIGYILTGIITGPYFLNILKSHDVIEIFSKIGVTVLLFIVGISLSPNVIREVGKVSLVTGVGQVLFTSAIGYSICLLLGLDYTSALYVSIALTFSSTIIVLKLLGDKGDSSKLYGKIAIGFLLVQDIIATVILIVVSAIAGADGSSILNTLITTLLTGFALAVFLFLFSGYLIKPIVAFVAKSQEFLFLFSIAFGLSLASLFYSVGFSIEIGALVAGVILSSTNYAYEISSRMRPLRDFFIVLFFILLGSQMVLSSLSALLLPAFVLSIFVLIGNPIIVIILMNLLGYSRKTGFMAGLTVAQISEFSLILATLGFQVGHISRDVLSLVTLVGLITIAGSTYFILYSDKIYSKINGLLSFLEFKKKNQDVQGKEKDYSIVLFGYDRVGRDFVRTFEKLKKEYIVVDYNPESINRLEKLKINNKYGDAEDIEFLQELNLKEVKLIVSTIPDHDTNMLLIETLEHLNDKAIKIVISKNKKDSKLLYKAGADYVIMPHYLGARFTSSLIKKYGFNHLKYKKEKEKHLRYIERIEA